SLVIVAIGHVDLLVSFDARCVRFGARGSAKATRVQFRLRAPLDLQALDRAARTLGERAYHHDERCEPWILREALRVAEVDLLQHELSIEKTVSGIHDAHGVQSDTQI